MTIETFVRTRSPSCLSDLMLDRLRVDELDEAAAGDARAHLRTCERCRERNAGLAAEHDALVLPPLRSGTVEDEAPAKQKPGRSSWRGAALALTAAAALTVFVWPDGEEPVVSVDDAGETSPGGVRAKGAGPQLSIFVEREGEVVPAHALDFLLPGDVLGVSYSLKQPRYLAVLGRDGAGEISTYFPRSGAMRSVEAGREVALDVGFELDDTLGEETVFGVFCTQPQPLSDLHAAVQRAPAEPELGPQCEVVMLQTTKRGRP